MLYQTGTALLGYIDLLRSVAFLCALSVLDFQLNLKQEI